MIDLFDLYKNCLLCPRSCGVDRLAGQRGFCGETAALRIAAAVLHRGEEPPVSGKGGSGAVFISGCNLGCVFCQNWQISHTGQPDKAAASGGTAQPLGRAVNSGEFAKICLKLQGSGAENINIVTGSHAVPAIIAGLIAAKEGGLHLPVLWNSSAYESPETLELLRDHVDIYLPDLKTLDSSLAANLFNAPGYPQAALSSILKMIDMINNPAAPTNAQPGQASQVGLIIRHLVLPGYLESTRQVLRWFAENVMPRDRGQRRILLSLMTQYTPVKNKAHPGRFLHKQEYETVLGWLDEFGIEDGFCQELFTAAPFAGRAPQTGRSDWLPDFNRHNPFSSELSVPVWRF